VSEYGMKSQAQVVVIGGGVVGCSVHPGVGTAGFEQNFIVTSGGAEFLTRTPMLFW
jgi:glycine/D-amino acid oxidase-like deaminating enzyme